LPLDRCAAALRLFSKHSMLYMVRSAKADRTRARSAELNRLVILLSQQMLNHSRFDCWRCRVRHRRVV